MSLAKIKLAITKLSEFKKPKLSPEKIPEQIPTPVPAIIPTIVPP